MTIGKQTIFRRYDPIAECWEDGWVFWRVQTGNGFQWVDHLDPALVDCTFDDKDGVPVDCWGEIWGTVSEITPEGIERMRMLSDPDEHWIECENKQDCHDVDKCVCRVDESKRFKWVNIETD